MSWPTLKLGELLSDAELFTDGDWIESKDQDVDGNVRLIQMADIGDGFYINKSSRFLNEETFARLKCTEIKSGDILIARMPDPLGRACIFPGDKFKSITVVDICVIRVNSNKIDARWLAYTINSGNVRSIIGSFAKGATRVRISRKNLAEIKIPFPPLSEQQHIAAILDKAVLVNRKRELAIEKLDELAQSVFYEMFGDTISNPLKIAEGSIGEIIKSKPNNGIFRKNPEYIKDDVAGGLPVAWVEDLFKGLSLQLSSSRRVEPTINEIKKYGLNYGDILFCRSSLKLDGIGFNNVYLGEKNKALFECHAIRIVPNLDIIDPIFLNYMLRTPSSRLNIKKQAKTVTMTTIDQEGLLRTRILIPPMDKQRQFSSFLVKLNQLLDKSNMLITKNMKLSASLQSQAFRN
jgi:type I restriction enzyme S subunit